MAFLKLSSSHGRKHQVVQKQVCAYPDDPRALYIIWRLLKTQMIFRGGGEMVGEGLCVSIRIYFSTQSDASRVGRGKIALLMHCIDTRSTDKGTEFLRG